MEIVTKLRVEVSMIIFFCHLTYFDLDSTPSKDRNTRENNNSQDETDKDEQDNKYLKKISGIDRFFGTHWNTWVFKLRYPIVIITLIIVGLAVWRASELPPAKEVIEWLPDSHPNAKLQDKVREDFNQGENDQVILVNLLWGVSGVDRSGTDRWDAADIGKLIWDDDFDLTPEANQQRVIDICSDLRSNSLVRNSIVKCWVEDFVNAQNGGNPVPQADFYTRLNDYITNNSTGVEQFSDNLIGLIDGTLRFSIIQAIANAERFQGYEETFPVYEDWEALKNQYNADSPTGVNKAIQTAKQAWAFLQTEKEFVDDARQGIAVSMAFGFLVILISTLNIINAMFSIFCIGSIVAGVIAIIEMLGWTLGVLESVSVVIIIGFSIDYVVHLANHYSESVYDDKFNRIKDSLQSIAVSIIAGAVTTLGSGFPIFFAIVTIFTKFAVLIWSTIWLALYFSLVMYAAINHIAGPQNKCGDLKYYIIMPIWKKIKQCFTKKNETEKNEKEAQISPQNSPGNK